MDAFEFVQGALDRGAVENIAAHFDHEHRNFPESRVKDQSGIPLREWVSLIRPLAPLDAIACRIAGGPVRLYLEKSSCRFQKPGGEAALTLHQDAFAVGEKAMAGHCCVAWMPLVDIDDETPSLEICPVPQRAAHPHHRDASRYAVLTGEADVPLVNISHMRAGDIVFMSPLTLHRTSVKPWHKKERLSLDLRFLPD
jgi:hypothetical protein